MSTERAGRDYRWNYRLWVLETAAWMFATAFIDSTTVLPVLVLALSDSPLLASMILSIRYVGQGWPQLIAASLVAGKPRRKAFYLRAAVPGRLLLLWPAVVLLLGIRHPGMAVTAVLLAYLAFWVSEGFSIVPWVDMLGKTVPAGRRGRLFGWMHVLGGVLGIVAGLLVRTTLQGAYPFPVGYGLLFFGAFAAIVVSTGAMALLREPPSHPEEERYSTRALIKDIPNMLRTVPQFRLLVLLQALFGFAVLPAPFYILYATDWLRAAVVGGQGEEALGVGIFLAIQTAGSIGGNALLGHFGDQYGNRLLLRVLAFLHTLVPLCALLAGVVAAAGASPWVIYAVFAPTFFSYGGLAGATWMGVTNFLLEIAPERDRPAYIAITNALNLPAIVLPMLGGLTLRIIGYEVIFVVAAIVLLGAFILSAALREPRADLIPHHAPPS